MTENESIPDLIFALEEQIDRIIYCRLKERGFPKMVPTHGRILMYLHEKSRANSPCQMNELAKTIRRKKNTVTTLVGKLEENKYVETHQSSDDRRVILVRITPQGEIVREVFKKIFNEVEGICRGNMGGKKKLLERLNIVLKNLEAEN